MRSAFSTLSIGLRALMAQQTALDTTAHNVANANTDGYTRQQVLMKAAPSTSLAINSGLAQAGNGVEVSTIRRMRDAFLDNQLRDQLAALGTWDTTKSNMEEIESIFNEPSDQGINALLGKMWASWHDLSANPGSYVARAAVVENSTVLASVIKRAATQLSDARTQADDDITSKVSDVNTWLSQIASLNQQIQQLQVANDPGNDLRDQRDLLLDKLAKALKITYQEQTNGSVTVSVPVTASGVPATWDLVNGSSYALLIANSMSTITVDQDRNIATTADQATLAATDGELVGLQNLRDTTLDPSVTSSIAGKLDLFASTLITQLNTQFDLGYPKETDTSGLTGFFTGTGASDIAVRSDLVSNPNLLRAAKAQAIVGGAPQSYGEPGDGENAIAIADLQNSTFTIAGTSTTLGDWYNALIGKVGVDSQQAQAMNDNQQLLVDHLTRNREAFSGVSLDEEATNMIQYQRAYEAAARVMTAADEMLDKIINGMGVVGR